MTPEVDVARLIAFLLAVLFAVTSYGLGNRAVRWHRVHGRWLEGTVDGAVISGLLAGVCLFVGVWA